MSGVQQPCLPYLAEVVDAIKVDADMLFPMVLLCSGGPSMMKDSAS